MLKTVKSLACNFADSRDTVLCSVSYISTRTHCHRKRVSLHHIKENQELWHLQKSLTVYQRQRSFLGNKQSSEPYEIPCIGEKTLREKRWAFMKPLFFAPGIFSFAPECGNRFHGLISIDFQQTRSRIDHGWFGKWSRVPKTLHARRVTAHYSFLTSMHPCCVHLFEQTNKPDCLQL